VDLINPVGGGSRGWGERNLERCVGGERKRGGFGTPRVFLVLG